MRERLTAKPAAIFRTAAILASGSIAGHLALFVAMPDQGARIVLNDALYALEGLFISGLLYWVARRLLAHSRRLSMAWFILATAQLAYICADITWAVLEANQGRVATPSPADWLYLTVYPLFLLGLWLLPSPPQSPVQQRRTVIDAAMVGCAAALAFWTFLVEPTAEANASASLPALLVSLAYPVGDMLLFWAVVRRLFIHQEGGSRRSLHLLLASATVMVLTDCVFDYRSLRGTYVSGGLLDMGWLVAMLLLALAGLAYLRDAGAACGEGQPGEPRACQDAGLPVWTRALPYASTCAAYALFVLSSHLPLSIANEIAIQAGVGMLVGLMLWRQGLEVRENAALSRQLSRANDELEWRVERRTADLLAANQALAVEVAERRQAEAALRDSEEHFRALAESASDAIVSTDGDGLVTYWNPGAEAMLGYTTAEIAGTPLQRLISGGAGVTDEGSVADRLRQTPSGYRSSVFELEGRRKDGSTFPAELSYAVWQGRQGLRLTAIVRDVSERRAMEQQLAQASKLESIGQLAAGIAHELNTPAQYVSSNLRFLRDKLGTLLTTVRQLREAAAGGAGPDSALALGRRLERQLGRTQFEYLLREVPLAIEQSLEGIGRVNSIVTAMKDFSHPGSSDKSVTDINRSLASTLTVARNEYKQVADVTTDLDPDLPPVPCYAAELGQVFLNIIINAAQAIEDVVGDGGDRRGTIAVSSRANDGWVEVRIADSGPGIPEDIAGRIFDPFFTTKDVGRGTGQGLAIAHSVMRKHGGDLTFESSPGKGTTFIIRLPVGA